jgi:hypothetical protein
LAGAALAQDDDAKALVLTLLPKKQKGVQEKIDYEGSVGWAIDTGYRTDTIKATLKRKIKTVDDEGMPTKEELSVESGEYREQTENNDGGSSTSSSSIAGWSGTVGRTSKSRLATGELGAAGNFASDKAVRLLRRDPDGLARALSTDEKVSVGEEWAVDLASLLLLYGPPRAKLVEEGSKAKATLESVKKKDDVTSVVITLKAKIKFTTPDEADEPGSIKIDATLRGPADGSGFPSKEKVSVTSRTADGSKETQTVTLERSAVEEEEEKR